MSTGHKLSLLLILAGTSIGSFAADCNTLENYGLQKSVIYATDGKNINLSDIDSCLMQCDALTPSGNPQQDAQNTMKCIGSLSTLKFAVNYENSKNAIDPNQFVNGPDAPEPSFAADNGASNGNQTTSGGYAQQPVTNQFQQSTNNSSPDQNLKIGGYTGGYIMNSDQTNQDKTKAKPKTSIRWY